jgi:hypothetical protein
VKPRQTNPLFLAPLAGLGLTSAENSFFEFESKGMSFPAAAYFRRVPSAEPEIDGKLQANSR